ncbi:MAG: hypothetical protein AAF436_17435 [Myxococcota bacterium]
MPIVLLGATPIGKARLRIASTALLALALSLGGCTPYVHSPPGRLLLFEAAKSLEKGETGVQAGGGGGLGSDIGFAGGFVRVRHGVARNLEFRVDLSALSLNANDGGIVGTDVLATAGAGIKYAFNPHFALAVDLAGGYWRGGGFLSPELRLIAAYDNPPFNPFIDAGYYTSHPLSANDVEAEVVVLFEDDEIENLGPPVFTQGWTAAFGFRIPTTSYVCCRVGSAIIFGMRFTGAYYRPTDPPDFADERDSRIYWSSSAGFEVVIP